MCLATSPGARVLTAHCNTRIVIYEPFEKIDELASSNQCAGEAQAAEFDAATCRMNRQLRCICRFVAQFFLFLHQMFRPPTCFTLPAMDYYFFMSLSPSRSFYIKPSLTDLRQLANPCTVRWLCLFLFHLPNVIRTRPDPFTSFTSTGKNALDMRIMLRIGAAMIFTATTGRRARERTSQTG